MKRLVAALAVVMSLAVVGSANAASKQIWHMTGLDQAASEIAGFPITVAASDNVAEWNALTGDDPNSAYQTLGFTYVNADPSFWIYNPYDGYDYAAYHTVFLRPEIYETFHTGLAQATPYHAATALLTLDHESQHQKLHSSDEGRVNACALADLPRFTAKWIVPTTTQDVLVPQTYRAKVRYRANVHGRWVWRYRYVNKVRYVTQMRTVANPAFTAVLDAAHDIYTNYQSAPYNTGTCW
jgi:hypothetical protein